MRFLALLLIPISLLAQAHRPRPKITPYPVATWTNDHWACPDGFRLPPNVGDQKTKAPICIPPPPQPPRWSGDYPYGVWDVPQTPLEAVWTGLTGKLIWKHYKIQYFPLRGRLPYCSVENMTHPLPDFAHDPKNLVLTMTSFEFDAPAGDMIAWKVWAR